MGKPLTKAQRDMLLSYADSNEPTDYAEFADTAGSALGWRNRERVIEALWRRGYLDADGITEAGKKAVQ
jgi:hypothetical protein